MYLLKHQLYVHIFKSCTFTCLYYPQYAGQPGTDGAGFEPPENGYPVLPPVELGYPGFGYPVLGPGELGNPGFGYPVLEPGELGNPGFEYRGLLGIPGL